MNFEIYIDSFTFYIEVTHFARGYPAKLWGRPEDCYEGCPDEIEWKVTCVEDCLEDGTVVEVTFDIDEYDELITEKLLALIAEISQDNEEYY